MSFLRISDYKGNILYDSNGGSADIYTRHQVNEGVTYEDGSERGPFYYMRANVSHHTNDEFESFVCAKLKEGKDLIGAYAEWNDRKQKDNTNS